MAGVKICPLCGTQRWANDGKIVMDGSDLENFSFMGYSISEIQQALNFARDRNWIPVKEKR